jgi:hypothetical protein
MKVRPRETIFRRWKVTPNEERRKQKKAITKHAKENIRFPLFREN